MVYLGIVHGFAYIGIGPIAIWARRPSSYRAQKRLGYPITAWHSHHSPLRVITRWLSIGHRYRELES